VSYEAIERMTDLKRPWVQQSDDGSTATYYGLCPECDNAMTLINPFDTLKITPHGRHVLEHVPGFTYDLERIEACARFKGVASSGALDEGDDAAITPKGRQVRNTLTENADLVHGIVAETTGVVPSRNLIRILFRAFFGNLVYLRPNIDSGNAPWLLFGTLRTYPLYGQTIRQNSDLAKVILRRAGAAYLGRYSRLQARPGQWIDIRFSLRQHRISGDEPPRETILLTVSAHGKDDQVTTLLEKTIRLQTESFIRRIEAREPPTRKGRDYIDIARDELQRHLLDRPNLE